MANGHGQERWKRIGWFIALWMGGVAAVSATAFLLKLVMTPIMAG